MKSDHLRFDKKLTEKILPKFNNAKDWSDLMQILKNLKENLRKYKDFNMYNVTDKITLSKRLAQCLNPKSLPSGLHEIALELYDTIFENIRQNQNNYLGDDLALYSVGLFPFFQFATVPNKTIYLNNIIKKHYLELKDEEFASCLPGFLTSILPCLDDQNETLIRNIKEIFQKARQKVGERVFYGELWSTILRTHRIRLVGMKYAMESIPVYKAPEENSEEDMKSFIESFYPNLNVLVINSLISTIEDENVHVQRNALDFIISRFPLTNKLLNFNQKISLVVSGLSLLVRNEYSTTRRLIAWLIGSNQDDDIDLDDPSIKYMIEILIASIKKIFSSKNDEVISNEKLLNGIKIIDQLFKQQVKLVDVILENTAIDLISSVEKYWSINPNANSNNDEIIKKIKKFFDYDASYLDCLWSGLGILLLKTVENFEKDENKSLDPIDHCVKLLKLCSYNIYLESQEKKNKFYVSIISQLLKTLYNLNEIQTEENKISLEKNITLLCLKFTKDLQDISNNIALKDNINMTISKSEKNIENYNSELISIDNSLGVGSIDVNYFGDRSSCKYNNKESNLGSQSFAFVIKNSMKKIIKCYEKNSPILETFVQNISIYQKYYINIIKRLLNNRDKLSKNDLKIFRIATELIIRIQEYSMVDNVPLWVQELINVVFCDHIQLSLLGVDFLLDLLIINSENQVYAIIKNFLSDHISEGDEEISNKINLFNPGGIKRNYSELAMAKLWILLDEQNHQKKVIDLIIKFYRADSYVFSNTISNSFAMNDLEKIVDAIKKFTQFWKLTSEYYPDIIFFENGDCIFKMLDFLDDEHPLLRHLSKSWLSQSVEQFNKILDPLINVLLDGNTSWYISPQKQLFITNEYNNKRIVEAFRKLKNIIINMTELSINFFVNTPVTQALMDMDLIGRELSNCCRTIPIDHYLELIVSISLRFLQGKFIESVSQAFYRENFSVNAAACEFLEFLLSFIEQKKIVMKIAESIAQPLLYILRESISSNDEVMQVQLLNLLKVILFNTQSVHQEFKETSKRIFDSSILHQCIILGIQDNYIFVRSHFISFLESCLPIFRNVLEPNSHIEIASKLLISISDYLFKRVNLFKKAFNIDVVYNNNNNMLNNKMNNLINISQSVSNNNVPQQVEKFFILENYLEDYKDNKVFDENDVNIIIKGIKEILFHFLAITTPKENSENVDWTNFKKNVISRGSNTGISYFGFFGSKTPEESEGKKGIDISLDIYQIFENTLASLISCWTNESDSYMTKDLCLSQKGILTYSNSEDIRFQKIDDIATSNNPSIFQNDKKFNQGKLIKNTKTIKNQIQTIALNLFLKNPFQFMYRYLNLWLNESNSYISNDKQYKLSMIELLVSLNIPTEVVLNSIYKNIDIDSLKITKKSKMKYKDIYPFILNKDICDYESKICQFLYSYIIYNMNVKTNINIVEIWRELINLLNIFTESKSPNTLFYVYEIINICLVKLHLKETNTDKSIKTKLITIIINLFNKNMDMFICNKTDIIFEGQNQLTLPLPPSIYEKVAKEIVDKKIGDLKTSYEKLGINNSNTIIKKTVNNEDGYNFSKGDYLDSFMYSSKDEKDQNIIGFYQSIYDYVSSGTLLKNDELLSIYRMIGFITLKSLFYSTMRFLFASEKNDKITPHVQTLVKNLLTVMNERGNSANKKYIELATEFLHSLMESANSIISISCKTFINEFFDQLWKVIIKLFSQNYPDMIVELLNKLNVSYFFSKDGEKIKTRALRRVSFIIYACDKDHFSSKLGLILEKVKEVITTYSENPVLESEIFLMIRVMFLRFSHENLVETLRLLWPIIFGELVSIIKEKKKTTTFDLSLNSLKLIELLSLANMEEFGLYQWIFMLDTFDFQKTDPQNNDNLFNLIMQNDNKVFKPFEMNLIKDFKTANEFNNYDINRISHDYFEKKGLILNFQKISGKEEVSMLLSKLFKYIILMNNFKTCIDWDAVENVIESDFLGISKMGKNKKHKNSQKNLHKYSNQKVDLSTKEFQKEESLNGNYQEKIDELKHNENSEEAMNNNYNESNLSTEVAKYHEIEKKDVISDKDFAVFDKNKNHLEEEKLTREMKEEELFKKEKEITKINFTQKESEEKQNKIIKNESLEKENENKQKNNEDIEILEKRKEQELKSEKKEKKSESDKLKQEKNREKRSFKSEEEAEKVNSAILTSAAKKFSSNDQEISDKFKVQNMGINDKIDIDNESEQVKHLRALNAQKSSNDVDDKQRKGFCTNCSIY